MKNLINHEDRRIEVCSTMDSLRANLFLVFDGILDGSIKTEEVENAVKTSNSIIQTIREESEEQTRRLERAVIEKERLANAITILSDAIESTNRHVG